MRATKKKKKHVPNFFCVRLLEFYGTASLKVHNSLPLKDLLQKVVLIFLMGTRIEVVSGILSNYIFYK